MVTSIVTIHTNISIPASFADPDTAPTLAALAEVLIAEVVAEDCRAAGVLCDMVKIIEALPFITLDGVADELLLLMKVDDPLKLDDSELAKALLKPDGRGMRDDCLSGSNVVTAPALKFSRMTTTTPSRLALAV